MAAQDEQDVRYDVGDGVARITMDRPEVHNAFRHLTLDQLVEAFETADTDPEVGVIVLTGAGDRAFSSGGDVNTEADFNLNRAWTYNRRLLHLAATMRNTAKPVIARINGWCVGGGNELNLLCDLGIAAEHAKFGQAGARVGSVPPFSAQILPRLIGERRAREVLLLCENYTAAEAERMGWVNKVVPAEDLDAAVTEWCEILLTKSPTALMMTKMWLNYETNASYPAMLGTFRMLNVGLHGSEEQAEGMGAFLEKRTPDFTPFR